MNIFQIILLVLISVSIVVIAYFLWDISLTLYFLKFDFKKHPVLINYVEHVLQIISNNENINIFNVDYDEMNANETNPNEFAVGLYVHMPTENQKRIDELLVEIENFEKRYGMPIDKICLMVGTKPINKKRYQYPHILLAKEQLMKYGLANYYSTHFHELGHHFAIKLNNDRSEKTANEMARNIILKHLPFYFQLFYNFRFEFQLDLPKMSAKEKFLAYYGYLKYYVKNYKTIQK